MYLKNAEKEITLTKLITILNLLPKDEMRKKDGESELCEAESLFTVSYSECIASDIIIDVFKQRDQDFVLRWVGWCCL